MSQSRILQMFNGNNFFSVNRTLAAEIGLIETIILYELIDKHIYFEQNAINEFDGWYYITTDDMEKRTTLTRYQQEPAIKKLIEFGFLQTQIKGLPGKRHFKLDIDILEDFLLSRTKSTMRKNPEQPSGKTPNIYKDKRPEEENIVVWSQATCEKLWYRNMKGKPASIDKSEVYKHFAGLGFSAETITAAIAIMQEAKRVNDPLPFLETICRDIIENLKHNNHSQKSKTRDESGPPKSEYVPLSPEEQKRRKENFEKFSADFDKNRKY